MTQRSMHVIADGLTYLEGPRWHQGRLWFVVCGFLHQWRLPRRRPRPGTQSAAC